VMLAAKELLFKLNTVITNTNSRRPGTPVECRPTAFVAGYQAIT